MKGKKKPKTVAKQPINKKLDFSFKVKGQEEKSGDLFIEGYANRAMMNGGKVIDRGREHIPSEEWKIDEWKKNPIIFFNHDRNLPVGKGVDAKVTKDGLWIKAKISNSQVPEIKKVYDLVKEEILRTFSVGIDVDSEEVVEDHLVLKGVNLLETSVVSIPMNQESFFSISQKQLKDEPIEKIRGAILAAKGAWVAAAVHEKINELMSGGEFNRADALTQIAGKAEIAQSELMDILAGNTASVEDKVLEALAEILQMDLAELQELNIKDREVADENDGMKPEETPDEEDSEENEDDLPEDSNEDSEESEEGDEELDEDSDEDESDDNEEDESEEELDEEENEDDDSEELGEEEEESEEDPSEESEEDSEEESDEESEDEEENNKEGQSYEECIKANIDTLFMEGKTTDQAIALAINMCSDGKGASCTLTKEQWEGVFKHCEELKKKKDESATHELDTTDQLDIDKGQASLQMFQQMIGLLGGMLGEIQKLNKNMEELSRTMVSPPGDSEEMELDGELQDEDEADEELQADPEEEELEDEEAKSLDRTSKYQEKLEENLKRFKV